MVVDRPPPQSSGEWAENLKEGWLNFYGVEDSQGRKQLNESIPQWHLVDILQKFLDKSISPHETARQLHVLISEPKNEDIRDTLTQNCLGCIFYIADGFGEFDIHEGVMLVLNETARLAGKSSLYEFHGLNMMFTESLQGPENLIHPSLSLSLDPKITQEPDVTWAKTRWRNICAFSALASLMGMSGLTRYASQILSHGVKNNATRRFPLEVYVLGDTEWILVAGEEIYRYLGGTTPAWDEWKHYFLQFASNGAANHNEAAKKAERTVLLMEDIEAQYKSNALRGSLQRLHENQLKS